MREGEVNTSRRSTFKLVAIALFFVLPVAFVCFYYAMRSAEATATSRAEKVTYAVEDFRDGTAQFFDHAAGGTSIVYYIIRGSDGVVRAAFDACDVCWREGKGFYQEGDAMVCRNCGNKYPSSKINDITPDCNPVPLPATTEGDKVVIDAEDLRAGAAYFRSAGAVKGAQCGGACCGSGKGAPAPASAPRSGRRGCC